MKVTASSSRYLRKCLWSNSVHLLYILKLVYDELYGISLFFLFNGNIGGTAISFNQFLSLFPFSFNNSLFFLFNIVNSIIEGITVEPTFFLYFRSLQQVHFFFP